MSNNKIFGTNINISKLLNNYINRINTLVNKYNIDICFNYDNIEYNLIENSILSHSKTLISPPHAFALNFEFASNFAFNMNCGT